VTNVEWHQGDLLALEEMDGRYKQSDRGNSGLSVIEVTAGREDILI
jgi:hypothetical protein